LIAKCDKNKDGKLDWHEFIMFAADRRRIINKESIQESFLALDYYQKGLVSYDDFDFNFSR
jgi:Ca2+-binding EF-hand superfamily protein